MTENIKLIIADDHELFRDGLCMLLRKVPGFRVIGEASNGIELIEEVKLQQPDVILTDIMMPEMNGITASKKITELYPSVAIIALSMFNEENFVVDMLEAGATGYLLKSADRLEIIESIKSVHKGKPYYCSNTSTKLAYTIGKSRLKRDNPKTFPKVSFTDRELKIIELVCKEKTNKEIAQDLFLSPRTVEALRIKIQEKMNVTNTAGMVIYAIRAGVFKIEDI